jgi:threonine dehydrogenase-like Zn-dependent dehydrogenase
MDKMKAYVFKDVGNLVFEEKPIPQVKDPDDVLLKVKAVGICGSDIKIIEGKHHFKPNTVLGHEFCGEVIEVGSHVHHVKIGDRVAVDNNIRCGFCSFCRMGLTSQCVDIKTSALGVMRDGGYAEYCLVPEKQCFVLPDEIDDILGTQVETLATVVNGMNTLLMLPYDYVLILGFGPIGYLFAQFAKNISAKVAVTEIDPFRINVAKECGLTVWNPNEVDIEQKITEFTYGRKADIVIEATGNALWQALKCVTPGGKVLPLAWTRPSRPRSYRTRSPAGRPRSWACTSARTRWCRPSASSRKTASTWVRSLPRSFHSMTACARSICSVWI